MTRALEAGSKALAAYTRQEAEAMGVRRTGQMLDAMTTVGPYHEGGTMAFYVTYEGDHTNSGNRKHIPRNGAVALYNERGARGRPKRPFNQRAVEAHETEIVQEIEDNLYK